jgi:hypothetical protein
MIATPNQSITIRTERDRHGRQRRIVEVPLIGPEVVAGGGLSGVGSGGVLPGYDESNRELRWEQDNGTPQIPSAWDQMVRQNGRARNGLDLLVQPMADAQVTVGEPVDDSEAAEREASWWQWAITRMGSDWRRLWLDAAWCLQDGRAPFHVRRDLERWRSGETVKGTDEPRWSGLYWRPVALDYFPTRALHSAIYDFDRGTVVGWNYHHLNPSQSWQVRALYEPDVWVCFNRRKGETHLGVSELRPAFGHQRTFEHSMRALWAILSQGSLTVATMREGDTVASSKRRDALETIAKTGGAKPGAWGILEAGETIERLGLDAASLGLVADMVGLSDRGVEAATGTLEQGVGMQRVGAQALADTHVGRTRERSHFLLTSFVDQFRDGPMRWIHRLNFGELRGPPPLVVSGIMPDAVIDAQQSAEIDRVLERARAGAYNQEQARVLVQRIAPRLSSAEVETMIGQIDPGGNRGQGRCPARGHPEGRRGVAVGRAHAGARPRRSAGAVTRATRPCRRDRAVHGRSAPSAIRAADDPVSSSPPVARRAGGWAGSAVVPTRPRPWGRERTGRDRCADRRRRRAMDDRARRRHRQRRPRSATQGRGEP